MKNIKIYILFIALLVILTLAHKYMFDKEQFDIKYHKKEMESPLHLVENKIYKCTYDDDCERYPYGYPHCVNGNCLI